jgi:hypothetical protein
MRKVIPMQYRTDTDLKNGETRIVRRFAWWPVLLKHYVGLDKSWIWLEWYYARERYFEPREQWLWPEWIDPKWIYISFSTDVNGKTVKRIGHFHENTGCKIHLCGSQESAKSCP